MSAEPRCRGPGSRAGRRRSASARATASAFASPETRNQTRGAVESAERQADAVGRRLRGVGHGDGDVVVDVELREAGEQRRDVTVGPEPEHTRSKSPAVGAAQSVGVRRGGGLDVGGVVRRTRHRVHAAPGRRRRRRGGPPGRPALRSGESAGDEALVAPPEVHPRPSRRPASGPQTAATAGGSPRRWCRRSARSRDAPGRLARRPALQAARRRRRVGQSASGVREDLRRSRGIAQPASFTRRFAAAA